MQPSEASNTKVGFGTGALTLMILMLITCKMAIPYEFSQSPSCVPNGTANVLRTASTTAFLLRFLSGPKHAWLKQPIKQNVPE